MRETQKMLDYLKSSLKNDEKEIENHKKEFVDFISHMNKDDLFKKPKKLTLWQKIKKVLNF